MNAIARLPVNKNCNESKKYTQNVIVYALMTNVFDAKAHWMIIIDYMDLWNCSQVQQRWMLNGRLSDKWIIMWCASHIIFSNPNNEWQVELMPNLIWQGVDTIFSILLFPHNNDVVSVLRWYWSYLCVVLISRLWFSHDVCVVWSGTPSFRFDKKISDIKTRVLLNWWRPWSHILEYSETNYVSTYVDKTNVYALICLFPKKISNEIGCGKFPFLIDISGETCEWMGKREAMHGMNQLR